MVADAPAVVVAAAGRAMEAKGAAREEGAELEERQSAKPAESKEVVAKGERKAGAAVVVRRAEAEEGAQVLEVASLAGVAKAAASAAEVGVAAVELVAAAMETVGRAAVAMGMAASAAAGRTMEEVAELRAEVAGGWALQAEPWAEPQAAVAMG